MVSPTQLKSQISGVEVTSRESDRIVVISAARIGARAIAKLQLARSNLSLLALGFD